MIRHAADSERYAFKSGAEPGKVRVKMLTEGWRDKWLPSFGVEDDMNRDLRK